LSPSCENNIGFLESRRDVHQNQRGVDLSLASGRFGIGNTLDFVLSPTRDTEAAKCFLVKTLAASHTTQPRVINVDKNAAYPKAFSELKVEGCIPEACELRRSKYLNNLIEQDRRFIKRLTKPGMGFFSFESAWRTDAADLRQ